VPGVGPHPHPWPDDSRLDPELLEHGDRRNVIDRYRYWKVSAIVADLEARRHPLQIAIQNWEHDFNIGSIVRTANAFNVSGVHIIGRRRWNRRGAMVTDRYLTISHHPSVSGFADRLAADHYTIIGVDNLESAEPLEQYDLPGIRLGGSWADRGARGGLRAVGGHHPVRFDPIAQRRCRRSYRDVPLGSSLGAIA
jgi:SpoU rRNA Methylase family